jgi:RHS repeat-associated protein
MYQPYGKMEPIAEGTESVRERFTGKEYDRDGAINGAPGVQLSYFGTRFYDPEVGAWTSVDPKDQLFNSYGYCAANPINVVDPNGEDFGLVTALAFGAFSYISNVCAYGSWNPGDWNWKDPGLWVGTTMTAFSITIAAISDIKEYYRYKEASKLGVRINLLGIPISPEYLPPVAGDPFAPTGLIQWQVYEELAAMPPHYEMPGGLLSFALSRGITSQKVASYLYGASDALKDVSSKVGVFAAGSAVLSLVQPELLPIAGTAGSLSLGGFALSQGLGAVGDILSYEDPTVPLIKRATILGATYFMSKTSSGTIPETLAKGLFGTIMKQYVPKPAQ